MSARNKELHRRGRSQLIRAAVLGANDKLIHWAMPVFARWLDQFSRER
jgi:hypothetical protein